MQNIDLLAETVGPMLAGAVLAFSGSPLLGFGAVAVANAISFMPEYLLLRNVFHQCERLQVVTGHLTELGLHHVHFGSLPSVQSAFLCLSCLSSRRLSTCRSLRVLAPPGQASRSPARSDPGLRSSFARSWSVWFTHPGGVPLITLAYAALYFTALSPHGLCTLTLCDTSRNSFALTPTVWSFRRSPFALATVSHVYTTVLSL